MILSGLPLRIFFCKGSCRHHQTSNRERQIFLKRVERICCSLICLIACQHAGKAKNIPWAGRKSLRKKGIKNIRAMAHKNDYQIQKQLDKPQTWFCKYYPARIRNVGEKEIADRQLVFDFKDGRAYEEVAQRTAENMLTLYGKGCVNIVFAPVPASTSESNELRYKAFCHS